MRRRRYECCVMQIRGLFGSEYAHLPRPFSGLPNDPTFTLLSDRLRVKYLGQKQVIIPDCEGRPSVTIR